MSQPAELDPKRVRQARRYWSEKTGEPYDVVPWEVVFLDTHRPLSAAEERWAAAIQAELAPAPPEPGHE